MIGAQVVRVPTAAVPSMAGVVEDGGNTVVTSALVKATIPVRVLKDATPAVPAATAPATNAVVASLVELSPPVGVGAAGVPVKVGDASGAYGASAVPQSVMSECVSVTVPVRVATLCTGAADAAPAEVTKPLGLVAA